MSRMTKKGQVTIPKRMRDYLGLKPGAEVEFTVGAHAAVADVPLLTRDPGRYRTYFPGIDLITPDTTSG